MDLEGLAHLLLNVCPRELCTPANKNKIILRQIFCGLRNCLRNEITWTRHLISPQKKNERKKALKIDWNWAMSKFWSINYYYLCVLPVGNTGRYFPLLLLLNSHLKMKKKLFVSNYQTTIFFYNSIRTELHVAHLSGSHDDEVSKENLHFDNLNKCDFYSFSLHCFFFWKKKKKKRNIFSRYLSNFCKAEVFGQL